MALAGAAQAAPGDPLQRVVYHVDNGDAERQRAALRTVRNHLNDVGDDRLDIRVVVQGNGVSMLILPGSTGSSHGPAPLPGHADDRVRVAIENLRIRGVTFLVCGNSLARRGIDAVERLYEVAPQDIVDSGIAELVRLQAQGYTYVKL